MNLSVLRKTYINRLSEIYPSSEITSIFRLLVAHRLHLDSAALVLEEKKELLPKDSAYFQKALERLQEKEPVQYIVGETYFYNLKLRVNSEVLIPRPETEELVAWIISDVEKYNKNKTIRTLDIGTGSGCIAISLAKNLPNIEVWAIDISPKALQVAKENANTHQVAVHFLEADILKTDELPKTYDMIISNPPYVRRQERSQMHGNVLQFEPDQALYVSDDNPLLFYKKIIVLATKYLNEKGYLYFEINQYLGKEVVQLLEQNGYKNIELRKDFLGNNRMLRAAKI